MEHVRGLVLRRTEEFCARTSLVPGTHQFFFGMPKEPGPFTSSLWLSSNGYFYSLRLVEGDVSHRRFTTPTWATQVT